MRDTGPTRRSRRSRPRSRSRSTATVRSRVSLRAGDGDGPWWIAIQQGLRPAVPGTGRFGAEDGERRVEAHLGADGRLGLDVRPDLCGRRPADHLHRRRNGDLFDPEQLGGRPRRLAVSANIAGVTIAGGLLKQTTDGRASSTSACCSAASPSTASRSSAATARARTATKFTAFFAVGAVNGPIGGPPAFFLTGIGGGFGINRELVVPTDSSKFGELPADQGARHRCQAAGPDGRAARARPATSRCRRGRSGSPPALVQQLRARRRHRGRGRPGRRRARHQPARPGADGAAAAAGGGRSRSSSPCSCASPHPRACSGFRRQLTDNSWLLYPDIKLTGGFAYVMWFKGSTRRVRADARRLPPGVPPRRLPAGAAARAALEHRRRDRHQGEQLLRADLRGADGRRRFEASAHFGPALGRGQVRRRRHRLLRSVPLSRSTSTRGSPPASRSTPGSSARSRSRSASARGST